MIKKKQNVLSHASLMLLLVALIACAPTPAAPTVPTESTPPTITPSPLPTLNDDGSAWVRITPGGRTICAHGGEYSFWLRDGPADDLLVYFEPGGGCWSADTCAPGSRWYGSDVSTADSPEFRNGIFDLDNPDNPLATYDMVYIPVCTGDVHMGSNVQTYDTNAGGEWTIHHMGFVNAAAALQIAYNRFKMPRSILVAGCSAGSPGSILHTPYIIEHYPDVPLRQLGDSLAFLFGRPVELQVDYGAHDNFPIWIPGVADIEPGQFITAEFYGLVASYYPDRQFAQFNYITDNVQIQYYTAIEGQRENWVRDLLANLDTIHAQSPANFKEFTASGSSHCILPRDTFYTEITRDTRFRDWFAAYAAGEDVPSIRCPDCLPAP